MAILAFIELRNTDIVVAYCTVVTYIEKADILQLHVMEIYFRWQLLLQSQQ